MIAQYNSGPDVPRAKHQRKRYAYPPAVRHDCRTDQATGNRRLNVCEAKLPTIESRSIFQSAALLSKTLIHALGSGMQQLVKSEINDSESQLANETKSDAAFMALLSLVSEIAEHIGVPKNIFQSRYQKHSQQFYDKALRELEDQAPSLAASLDRGPISEVPDVDDSTPLFDS